MDPLLLCEMTCERESEEAHLPAPGSQGGLKLAVGESRLLVARNTPLHLLSPMASGETRVAVRSGLRVG